MTTAATTPLHGAPDNSCRGWAPASPSPPWKKAARPGNCPWRTPSPKSGRAASARISAWRDTANGRISGIEKERVDAKRGKIFARLIKEVTVAAKVGGGDSSANPRLRLALERAREANVPGDNIERAVKRGSGQLEGGAHYLEVRYEGYGAGGAAILLDCMTDNKNRTLPEVRQVFGKHGGHLGEEGSVSPTSFVVAVSCCSPSRPTARA